MGDVNTTKLTGVYRIRPDPPLERISNRSYIWDAAWLLDRNDYWVRVGHKNAGEILLGSMNWSPWALFQMLVSLFCRPSEIHHTVINT